MSVHGTTTIILTRHGETERNRPPRFHGRADLALSATGVAQAKATGRHIASAWRPSVVVTSPLRRCLTTGDLIGAQLGIAARSLDGFNDIDYGDWQGLTIAEAKLRWPKELAAWLWTPQAARIPGGESLVAVAVRVAAALRELLDRHTGETVVVVGHSCINRIVLLQALGWPLSRFMDLRQDKCAISELTFSAGQCRLGQFNATAHLKRASAPRRKKPDGA
jgi:broad specificity phosphatase PhoE